MSESTPTAALTVSRLPSHVQRAVHSAHEKKAFDVVVLSLENSDAFTDYFVLCSARNTRQVRAIVDEIKEQLRAMRSKPSHVEGYEHAEWVLIDFFDCVVHVFTQETRRFYDLERLWGSARRIKIPQPS